MRLHTLNLHIRTENETLTPVELEQRVTDLLSLLLPDTTVHVEVGRTYTGDQAACPRCDRAARGQ